MDNFKQASKLQLRFNTSKGVLTIEQLWDLSMESLATIIRNIKKEIIKEDSDELSFLDQSNTVDPTVQLSFNIVKDIYLDKKLELEAARSEAESKAHNQKILEIIKRKQDGELEGLTITELEEQLR